MMRRSWTPHHRRLQVAVFSFLLFGLSHEYDDHGHQAAAASMATSGSGTCRSYCGNMTVDYPFGLRAGCGHPGFRDLLFCINGMLMLHLPSGSYRVLDIDYAYGGLTLREPGMSDCYSLARSPGGRGNGFVVEPWRAPYLAPDPDNVFLLLGCDAGSPLFQGFPGKHLPCRNVSGMGCEEYYQCPAWGEEGDWPSRWSSAGSSLSSCCAVGWGPIRAINLSRLGCEGYSSAYSVAPVRERGPGAWTYGIRAAYTVPADHRGFCAACEATAGICGYDTATTADLCLCGDWNSTSNCDNGSSSGSSIKQTSSSMTLFWGPLIFLMAWTFTF